jgi:hypothetical protein
LFKTLTLKFYQILLFKNQLVFLRIFQ